MPLNSYNKIMKHTISAGDKFWIKYGIVCLIGMGLMFISPMLGFSFIVFIILGFLLLKLFNMDKKDSLYLQSPWFYEFAKILIIFTLIITALVTYYLVFKTEAELQSVLSQPPIEVFVILILIASFFSFPVGLIIAGIKSIKEKESLSIGSQHITVKGSDAIVEGIKYLVLGGALLLGFIYALISIFL